MKRVIVFVLLTSTLPVFANVNHINMSKISTETKLIAAFDIVFNNQHFYDHWSAEWRYDIPKEDLIKQLRLHYTSFAALTPKNQETDLLLGDIAHYLYNMDDSAYYRIAVRHYEDAIQKSPQDYRGYWFLGYHCSQSNVPVRAIQNFKRAEQLLPTQPPADFWSEYAMATALVNMPSHCLYAMDKEKMMTGQKGGFEQELGETIRGRIVPMDKNKSYGKKEIWSYDLDGKAIFISRALGTKILMDSTWEVSIYDYEKNQSAFIINPPKLSDSKKKEIGYTIAILMKTADDKATLEQYINTFVSKYPEKKKMVFSDKYEKMVAYEMKDKSMYPELGGGRFYMIGIERDAPAYPGLLLENPVVLPNGTNGEVHYYRAKNSQDRFKGKIFYAVILDTCEAIHAESLKVFKTFFDQQLIIE